MRHRFVRLEDLAAEIGNEYGVGRVRDDGVRGEAAADICAGGPVWPRWSHAEPASLERLNVPVSTSGNVLTAWKPGWWARHGRGGRRRARARRSARPTAGTSSPIRS